MGALRSSPGQAISAAPAPLSSAAASAPHPASLPVVETFHSLQGEGAHSGRSAWFLRLAGCSVGCPWCDTKVSWPVAAHPRRSLAELAAEAAQARASGAAFAVVTGGEPLEHDLAPLCSALAASALPLHLETSGVPGPAGEPTALDAFAWITLSPKPHRPPHPALLAACHELKVVVQSSGDVAFAEAMATTARAARPSGEGPQLYLQPAWQHAEGQTLAIAHVQAHPAWRLSLQSHKWLGLR